MVRSGQKMNWFLVTEFEVGHGPASAPLCSNDECDTMRLDSDWWEREKKESSFFVSPMLVLARFITRIAQMFCGMSRYGSMQFSISFLAIVSEFWYHRISVDFSRKNAKTREIGKSIFSLRWSFFSLRTISERARFVDNIFLYRLRRRPTPSIQVSLRKSRNTKMAKSGLGNVHFPDVLGIAFRRLLQNVSYFQQTPFSL